MLGGKASWLGCSSSRWNSSARQSPGGTKSRLIYCYATASTDLSVGGLVSCPSWSQRHLCLSVFPQPCGVALSLCRLFFLLGAQGHRSPSGSLPSDSRQFAAKKLGAREAEAADRLQAGQQEVEGENRLGYQRVWQEIQRQVRHSSELSVFVVSQTQNHTQQTWPRKERARRRCPSPRF